MPPHSSVEAATTEPLQSTELGSESAASPPAGAPSTTAQSLFTLDERSALQEAWDAVIASATREGQPAARLVLGQAFIEQVLREHPSLANLFPFTRGEQAGSPNPAKLQAHGAKVLDVVGAVVAMISKGEDQALLTAVDGLVRRHLNYKVELEHYDMVLGVFASFLSGALKSLGKWDDVQAAGWGKVVGAIKGHAATVYAQKQAA